MPKKAIVKTDKIDTELYNLGGEKIGRVSLPKEIFDITVNKELLSQAIRVYLANQRLGTHSTKTRSEVAGSTRKIYKQKGTGRARHGDVKAPIFIGGGLAFGARPRDYSLNLSKKMKKVALFGSLTDKLRSGKMKVLSGLKNIETRTRKMAEVMNRIGFDNFNQNHKIKILLVTPQNLKNVILSGRNLENFDIISTDMLNTYEIVSHSDIVFMEESIPVLKGHFLKKENTKENILHGKTIEKKPKKQNETTPKKAAKKLIKKTKTKRKIVKKA